jgi:hypothetical protein
MTGGRYQHGRMCAICGEAKGFTRRFGDMTVCNAHVCVEKARVLGTTASDKSKNPERPEEQLGTAC